MGEKDYVGGILPEILGVAMDQPAADVQFLDVGLGQVGPPDLLEVFGGDADLIVVFGDHRFEHAQGDDVGEMGIGAIAVLPEGPEDHHAGLHRMGGEDGLHLQTVDVVPDVELQVVDLEIVEEVPLGDGHEGGKFLGHRGPDQRGGEIFDAVVGPHQGGKPGHVVVVGVGVEDAVDLVDPDAQGHQAVEDVGTGVDEVDLALEHEDARHAGPVGIPSVALPGVDHGEIFPADEVESEGIRRAVAFVGGEVEVDGDGLPFVFEPKDVEALPMNDDPVSDLDRFGVQEAGIQQFFGRTDAAEGEFQLQAHHLMGGFGIDARFHDLFFGDQPVIAPVDVLDLGVHLVRKPDEHGFDPGVVGVLGDDHPLTVEHL